MITLLGHGYIGCQIARELLRQEIVFEWATHKQWKPAGSVIINAAGYTGSPNVDACETHKADCIRGNVTWPQEVERRCAGLPVIHISSGCIYDGYKMGGWTEEDAPNFDFANGSFYSGCKALGEELLKPYMHKSYILRIRIPFGGRPDPKNYLSKLETYERLIDVENSLSSIEDVAKVAVHFALMRPPTGIYNVCNPGSIRTSMVTWLMGLKKQWFTMDEFRAAVVAPRSNCVLNVDKLMGIYELNDVRDAVKIAIRGLEPMNNESVLTP